MLARRDLLAKLLRFGVAGAASSVFYAVCTWLLAGPLEVPAVYASAMGYVTAVPLSFFLQRNFSFRSKGSKRAQAPRFLLVHGLNILVSVIVMHVLVSSLHMDYRAGIALTMVLIPLLSFLAMNTWVFHHTEKPRPADFP
ncbi:MAG: GtrA family protein [Pseudoxanthomonas sp.]